MANNSTDTGESYIRVERGGNIIIEEALIKEGTLEGFQLGTPDQSDLLT